MNQKSKRALHIFLASVVLLISCDVSTLVAPPQVPTPIPGALNLIVAQTAAAAATETEAAVPPTYTLTFTPFPSQTPANTPTITPTFIFYLRTPTPSAISGTLNCYVVSQTPQDGANFHGNKVFTLIWVLSNTGTGAWPQNSVHLKFTDGDQLSKVTVVNLPNSVPPGDAVTLSIDMTTPSKSGKYTTYWALAAGDQNFCSLFLRITVQ
jgi:hypothetical protein